MNSKAQTLFESIKPDFLEALNLAPEYGSISLTVYLNEFQPVRIESGQSKSIKLCKKAERGL